MVESKSCDLSLNVLPKVYGQSSNKIVVTIMKPFGVTDADIDFQEGEVISDIEDHAEENNCIPPDPSDTHEDLLDLIPLNQTNGKPYIDTQILVDGVPVYKATILKNEFAPIPLSRDRLRRVQTMTPYILDPEKCLGQENCVLIGDPVK